MMTEKLNNLLENHIKKSTNTWSEMAKMTQEELKAIEKFAKEKNELFREVFDSPEKFEQAQQMLKQALK